MQMRPSERQFDELNRPAEDFPLALFYQYSLTPGGRHERCRPPLEQAARSFNGRLVWAARGEQVLVGTDRRYEHTALFEFPDRLGVLHLIGSREHASACAEMDSLEVMVLTQQPAAVSLLSSLLARVMPLLPQDGSIDDSPEPGLGTSSVMPTPQALDEFRRHPDQDTPITMVNWLKFRPRAQYPDGEPVSGRAAYRRYGRAALRDTHSVGAKLVYAGRYRLTLIGNDGDPAPGRWNEFALMQYPGRQSFALMSSLRRYRRALADREAGLADRGQSLVVTRPDEKFTWRR